MVPLACPRCHQALPCDCGAHYPVVGGIQDFAPDLRRPPGLAQRAMQSRPVVRVYERGFRPMLTRLVTDLRYADEEAFLAAHVGEGPALDVACGTGRYTRWLAQRFGADQVVGMDLSRPMLRRASRRAPTLSFVRASALALPFPDQALGTVTCFGALHLFPDPAFAVSEVGRVLRPDGRFVGLTAATDPRWAGLQTRLGRAIGLRFLTPTQIEGWCEAAGLTLETVDHHGGMLLFSARRVYSATEV